MRTRPTLIGLLVAALVLLAPPVSAVSERAEVASVSAGHNAWISVAVARLWQSPSSPRAVDRPALTAPVRIRAWLRGMSLAQRRALSEHSDTEGLMGERVVVRRVRAGWAEVVVPDQPSQKDSAGYPGWVPVAQLTATPPAPTGSVATVVSRTSWLRSDNRAASPVTEISSGTTLSSLGRIGSQVRVRTPDGAPRRIQASTVVVHPAGTAALVQHRGLLATAMTFRRLPYLWGGLSGFGLDCSGLTWLSNRLHGTLIPRDALPQSRHGARVTRAHLRPGDLVFYATHGLVHHVTMYAGRGRMIEAPHTGGVVRVVRLRLREYAGARRY
jgi:cell wall-associated NlpC family hydrolase